MQDMSNYAENQAKDGVSAWEDNMKDLTASENKKEIANIIVSEPASHTENESEMKGEENFNVVIESSVGPQPLKNEEKVVVVEEKKIDFDILPTIIKFVVINSKSMKAILLRWEV